jgi:hypothetical protein
MGGWYDTYAFAPGASYGQWLSALARHYSIARDEAERAKMNRVVRGYAATINPVGKFYIENRFPSYTYDKLVWGSSTPTRLCWGVCRGPQRMEHGRSH